MKSLIAIMVFILFSANTLKAQSFYRIDDYCFGTTKTEELCKVLKIGSKYYLAGTSNCKKAEWDKTENNCDTIFSKSNFWTVATSNSFYKIWDKTYGGRKDILITDAINYRDGILLCGYTTCDSSCTNYSNGKGSPTNQDFILYYLDTLGNKINEIRLGSFTVEKECKVIETSDKGLLIVGVSDGNATGDRSQNSWGLNDFWGIKLDSLGNKQWDNAWGGNASENLMGGILPLFNNKDLLYGTTSSGISGTVTGNPYGLNDGWVILIDSTGSRVWDKTFGGSGNDNILKIIKMGDFYYMLGSTNSISTNGGVNQLNYGNHDIWLMKTDTNGNLIWETRYGASSEDYGIDLIANSFGGFFLLGNIATSGNGTFTSVNYGSWDHVIMSIDTSGTLLSYKILGGNHQDYAKGMLAINDSTLLLYGTSTVGTSDVKTCEGHLAPPPASNAFNTDYWIIKVGYGNTTTSINQLQNNLALTVRPNPAKNHIDISGLPPATYTINTFSLDGRLVMSNIIASDLSLPLSIESLQSGMYLSNIINEKINTTVRWVKE